MKKVSEVGAQGDVLFMRLADVGLSAIPPTAVEVAPDGAFGAHIVAHSETGHHHVVPGVGVKRYADPADPFTCYLRLEEDLDVCEVMHLRDWDTHETLAISPCEDRVIVVRRQREYTPEGFRLVVD